MGREPGSVLAAVKPVGATPSSTGQRKAKPSLSDHSQPSKKPPPKRSLQDQWQAEDTKRQKLQVCCLPLHKNGWTPEALEGPAVALCHMLGPLSCSATCLFGWRLVPDSNNS